MRKKTWLFWAAAATVVAIGGTFTYASIAKIHTKIHTKITISAASVQAAKGMELRFSQPVRSVRWTYNGQHHLTSLPTPQTTVWLNANLPQNAKVTFSVDAATGRFGNSLAKPAAFSEVTPAPLYVMTNPGIYQYNVPVSGPFTLKFSAPVANRAAVAQDISFQPPVPGKLVWTSGSLASFVPSNPIPPTQPELMTIRGGLKGPQGSSGQYLSADVKRPFITASDQLIVVKESKPETLTLYKNGKAVFKTLANTGIPGAATPKGHFYIRSMALYANMRGTEPNGQPYYSPHVPWVMGLFGNIAIHGYIRSSYGFPQSVGCVELPVKQARILYHMVKVGTPVDIQS